MEFNKVLSFELKGRTGHFKKYYSNKNSLSYILPTRTVLMGMVASILAYPRDSYYEIFSPKRAKFGLQIVNPVYKHFECMNYLNHKEESHHTQVRLQLILPKEADNIKYRVYFAHKDNELMDELSAKLKAEKQGFGLFFGQRQFRATADNLKVIESPEIIDNYAGPLSSLTFKDNIKTIDPSNEIDLIVENMPVDFQKVDSGREPTEVAAFCYEENGKKIPGEFNQGIKIDDKVISFYTPV